MTPQQRELGEGIFGVGSAWAAVGITSWADVGSAAAAIYTCLLILWFLWRRFVRPFLEKIGLKEPRHRRSTDFMHSGNE